MSSNVFAAWTITASITTAVMYSDNSKLYEITLNCVSDGSDPAAFKISDCLVSTSESIYQLYGGYIYEIVTDPGTEPDNTWNVTFSNKAGATLLSLTGLSTTATEYHKGSKDKGQYPLFDGDLTVDINDIGSNNDSVAIVIKIQK